MVDLRLRPFHVPPRYKPHRITMRTLQFDLHLYKEIAVLLDRVKW